METIPALINFNILGFKNGSLMTFWQSSGVVILLRALTTSGILKIF